jgi:N-acetylmuramoyl-L-alanine amidase
MVDVYISPSVQEGNIGFGTYGTEEERMNLVADIVQYELERNGLTTARNKPSESLTEIVADSNALGAKVHLAIHSNASTTGTARGPEIIVYRFGGNAEDLAIDIYNYLEQISPAQGRGILEGADEFGGRGYFELRRTRAPAVLIETAFHDNPADAQFIIDNIYQIGVAIAKGTLDFFGKPYTPDTLRNINRLKERYNGVYFE